MGAEDYPEASRRECRAFVNQLRRHFGEEPEGAQLKIRRQAHDFGSYLEVVVEYDTEMPASIEYAFEVDTKTPGEWDDIARRELGIMDLNLS